MDSKPNTDDQNKFVPDPKTRPIDIDSLPDLQGVTVSGRRSIRSRLLGLAWGMTIIAIVVITGIAIDSANSVGRRAQQASSESLLAQAQAYLAQTNANIAEQNNLILDRAARDVQTVADAATAIYSGELPSDYWPPQEHLLTGPEGQYLNGPDDVSSIFVPVTKLNEQNSLPPEVIQDVETSAYLDLLLRPVFQNSPGTAAIYLGTVNDVTRYYPNIELGKVVPADFQVTQRVWYTTSLEGNLDKQTPEPVWSPVYLDATGLGLVTTVAIPAYKPDGELIGVIGLDLTLDEIRANIETTSFYENGYSFLIDADGNGIILPEQGYQDILGRAPEEEEFSPSLVDSPEFGAVISLMMRGESGLENIQVGGRELFIAYAPLRSSGWSLGSVAAAQDVLQDITKLQSELNRTTLFLIFTRVLPAAILVAILLVSLASVLTNRLANPIQKLAEAAQKISAGQLDTHIVLPPSRDRPSEITLLATTLNDMATRLRRTFAGLEQRVADRTHQLERRSLQLQTAAEVARDITTSKDMEELLQAAVNMISQRFGYYNVGIFLVDDVGEYAHLRAASGELGDKLLEQEIRLRVGQEGIIGYVTRYGEARIASDVSVDTLFFKEPLLPDTRSEVALPLHSGGKVIGALDVQSVQERAFDQDDIVILQTLADQLAIAIENARLVSQLQATLQETNLLYQEQVRETWSSAGLHSGPSAFEYDRLEVRPASSPNNDWMLESKNGSQKLIVPVKLRDQVIGFIGLESDDADHEWTTDEIAIVEATANQAAVSVENARLLKESQLRAAREQMVGEVTSQMRASLDMDLVLRTAIRQIAEKLGVAQVEVHLGADLEDKDDTNGR
jgi:GAF domain-containing protein/HAMP domain-containing protein